MTALKKNLQSGKEASEQLKSGSQKVVAAIDGKTLSGAAYTAGKGLFSDLILPTISKVTSALDKVEQELQTYTNADGKVANEGNLDEDKLTQQIATKKAMKASVEASAAVARSLSRNNPVAKVLDALLNVEASLNRMSNEYEQDIQELQEKLEKLQQFASETSGLFSSSLDNMNIAMQGCLVLNNTTINSDGTYSLPKGTDKSWFTSMQSKDKRSSLEVAYDEVKEWNKLYKEFIRTGEKSLKSIWYGARVSRLSDGTLIVTTATGMSKRLDEFTGFSKFVKQHKNFTRISSNGTLSADGMKIFKEAKLNDVGTVTRGVSGRFKDIAKATWGAVKSDVVTAIKKPVTFGLNTIVKDAKSLKTAKGLGKVIPGLNIVSGMIDVGTGLKDSYSLAKEDGLSGGQVVASQAGGVVVDVAKVAMTTTAASVAATAGAAAVTAGLGLVGIATAPVGLTAAAAVIAGWGAVKGVEFLDKKLGVTKKLKQGVNGLIKGVSGWFK